MLGVAVEKNGFVVTDLRGLNAKVTRGSARAMNRAATSGRAVMARAIAEDTGLKVGDIKAVLPIRTASPAQLEASVRSSLARIALSKFKAQAAKKGGVSYAFGNSGRRTIPTAFIARVKAGSKVNPLPDSEASFHVGVFVRRAKKRLPIDELAGPSLGHVFIRCQAAGLAQMNAAYETAFQHEFNRIMGGASDSEESDAGAD